CFCMSSTSCFIYSYMYVKSNCILWLHVINYTGSKRRHVRGGGITMARMCVVTGRQTRTGNHRAHAMNSNKPTWTSNVQKVRIMVDGKPKRVYVSARALKSGKVERV